MRRTSIIVGIVLVLAAGGLLAYTRLRPRPTAQRGDPAVAVAFAIGALERSDTNRLAPEQIKTILPLLRVLRDTDPNDAEASRALAEQIQRTLTPEQRAALDRMREEARTRRQQAQGAPGQGRPRFGPGGPGGPGVGGGGPGAGGTGAVGGTGAARAEIRQRVLSRVILFLERQLSSGG